MPTYEYACDACGHRFEEFRSITAPAKRTCPKCRKPKLRRLLGAGGGIIFKGGGFYETDYRSDSYKKAAEADKKPTDDKSEPAGDDSSSKKTETKAESKVESKSAKKSAKKPKPKS